MNRYQFGKWGEQKAAQYLKKENYQIIKRNYRNVLGEIDLIAIDNNVLVFFEVKTRSNHKYGRPQEAVDPEKQRKIRQIARFYLAENYQKYPEIRFDVISIIIDFKSRNGRIEHFKAVF